MRLGRRSVTVVICFIGLTSAVVSRGQGPPAPITQEQAAAAQAAAAQAAAAQAAAAQAALLQRAADNLAAVTETAKAASKAAADAATEAHNAAAAAATASQSAADATRNQQAVADQAVAAKAALDKAKTASDAIQEATDAQSIAGTPLLVDYVPCLIDSASAHTLRGQPNPNSADLTHEQLVALKAAVDKILSGQSNAVSTQLDKLPAGPVAKSMVRAQVDAGVLTAQQSENPIDPNALAALSTLLDRVAAPPTQFTRPADISCSMSIFPWDIAHMVFGRTVANHYLAVQIVVRNLDQEHEFLIHDSELAVDVTSGQLERFQASHEKQAVRAVTIYGQNYDRRAFFTHAVESIGIIMGAVVGLPSPVNDNLVAASGAYSAGFMPSWQRFFPDLSTNNLNNLNDLGFSAASNSRIVVPKGGSVPFVIFVPVEPLEQACWLAPGYDPTLDKLPLNACEAVVSAHGKKFKKGDQAGVSPNRATVIATTKYQKWTPIQLGALQKHTFAVIAGMHIQQATPQSAALRLLSCMGPEDGNGVLLLAAAPASGIKCSLVGAGLDSLATLRLKSATPASTVDIPVTPGTDGTLASVNLTSDVIAKLTAPSYALFGVDKASTEMDLTQTLALNPAPSGLAVTAPPSGTATAANGSLIVTVTGSNLSQVANITLKTPDGVSLTMPAVVSGVAVSATFPNRNWTPGDYEISFGLFGSSFVFNTMQKVTLKAPPSA